MIKAIFIASLLTATMMLPACAPEAPEPVLPEGPEPVRPADLDKRLSLETMLEHDQLEPNDTEAFEVAGDVMMSIFEELKAIDEDANAYHLISEPRQALYAVFWVEAEINNGGLSQYYYNSAGDQAAKAPQYLRELGLDEAAEILEEANAFFPDAAPPKSRQARQDVLDDIEDEAAETWNELDERFYQSGISFKPNMINYIRDHRNEFYKID